MDIRDPVVMNWLLYNQNQNASQERNPLYDVQQPSVPRNFMPESQSTRNPIMGGTRQAIDAARESLRATEEDKQTAFGNALMRFGANYLASNGNLGASISPALEGYLKEEQAAQALNYQLMQDAEQREMEEAKEARRRYEFEQELALNRQRVNLAGRKDPLLLQEERKDAYIKKLTDEGKLKEGEFPITLLNKSDQSKALLDLNGQIKEGHKAHDAIKHIKNMQKILNDNPKIANSLTNLILLGTENGERQSFLDGLKKSGVDQKTRTALEVYAKEQGLLEKISIDSAPAKVMTDMHKALIRKITPNMGMTNKAQLAILDQMENQFKDLYEYGKYAKDARNRRVQIAPYFVDEDIEGLEAEIDLLNNGNTDPMATNYDNNTDNSTSNAQDVSGEKIKLILEALKRRGMVQ